MPVRSSVDSAWDDDRFRTLLEIDRCCRAFERAWRAGERLTIEAVLFETNLPCCSELAIELIAVEWELREEFGKNPVPEDYLDRFPEFRNEIHCLARQTLVDTAVLQAGDTSVDRLQVVGEFSILGRIGQGGMGMVYEAVRQSDGQRVALKMLPSLLTRQPGLRERFAREVAVAATLKHSHIVPALAWNIETEPPYLAMELVEGKSLRELLEDWNRVETPRPMPTSGAKLGDHSAIRDRSAFACRVGVQIAGALQYAHDQGILHRDVKPSNIMLQGETLLLTDFGLAKMLDFDDDLTISGDFIGTLRYAAPETLDGQHDARSEVYSLGLTLYEILALKPAFPQTERGALVKAVANGLTLQFPATTSPALKSVIRKACAMNPGERFPTASAFGLALQNCSIEPLPEVQTASGLNGAEESKFGAIWGRLWRWMNR